jgi:hypothetical protein
MKKITKILAIALLAIMSLTVLAACAPNADPDKAKAALEKNEYKATKSTGMAVDATELLLGIDDLECIITGTKTVENEDGETKVEHVTIYYFEDAKAAKAAFAKLQGESDEEKEEETDWVFKQSGAMVYYGTKAAVKAAR